MDLGESPGKFQQKRCSPACIKMPAEYRCQSLKQTQLLSCFACIRLVGKSFEFDSVGSNGNFIRRKLDAREILKFFLQCFGDDQQPFSSVQSDKSLEVAWTESPGRQVVHLQKCWYSSLQCKHRHLGQPGIHRFRSPFFRLV